MEELVQFADKESKPDPNLRCSGENVVSGQRNCSPVNQAHRCKRGHLVFLDSKHEDRENQI